MNYEGNGYIKYEIEKIDNSILQNYYNFSEVMTYEEYTLTTSSYTKCVYLCKAGLIDVCVGDYWMNDIRIQLASFILIYEDKGFISLTNETFQQFKHNIYDFRNQIITYLIYGLISLFNYHYFISKLSSKMYIITGNVILMLILVVLIMNPISTTLRFEESLSMDTLIEKNQSICVLEVTLSQNYRFINRFKNEYNNFVSVTSYTVWNKDYRNIIADDIPKYGLPSMMLNDPLCTAATDSFDIKKDYYFNKHNLNDKITKILFPIIHDYQVGFFIRNELVNELQPKFWYILSRSQDIIDNLQSYGKLEDRYQFNFIPVYIIIILMLISIVSVGSFHIYIYNYDIEYYNSLFNNSKNKKLNEVIKIIENHSTDSNVTVDNNVTK